MKLKQLLLLLTVVSWCLSKPSWAGPEIGGVKIVVPVPAGYAEVTPQMVWTWQLVESNQGENRILGFYIPSAETKAALAGRPNLDRNINVQIRRKLESRVISSAEFEHIKTQLQSTISSRQISAAESEVLEKVNGNLAKLNGTNLHLAQAANLTLPPHLKKPDLFAYSEISTEQVTLPDGVVHRAEVTSTTAAVLVKGKLLMCNVTGIADDLPWTRATATRWTEAIIAANQ